MRIFNKDFNRFIFTKARPTLYLFDLGIAFAMGMLAAYFVMLIWGTS